MVNPTVYGDTGTGTCLLGHTLNPYPGSVTTFNDVGTLASKTFVGGNMGGQPNLTQGRLVLLGSVGNATCGHTTVVVQNSILARVLVNGKGIQCTSTELGGGDFPAGIYAVNPVTTTSQLSVRIAAPITN